MAEWNQLTENFMNQISFLNLCMYEYERITLGIDFRVNLDKNQNYFGC